MFIQQLSVFLENAPGRMAAMSNLLGEQGIDMLALSVADTRDFGILRAIVGDTDKALAVLRQGGFTASLTDVLAVAVPDRPGGLGQVLTLLQQAAVSVEYLYSFVRHVDHKAVIILRVSDPQRTEQVFTAQGISMLSQQQITGM